MFLTDEQIAEMTGYRSHRKQAEWLATNGYSFDVRSDGRPNVLIQQIVERQCKIVDSKPVPNLGFLD